MLLYIIVFVSLFIIGFGYGGIRLAHTLKEVETQIFFWILYGISFLTVVQLAFCIFIFTTMSGKTGPGGPRGFQGPQGEIGTKGRCGQEEKDSTTGDYVNECKTRSLAIMIEKMVEEHNQETVDNAIKSYICGFVNHTAVVRVSGVDYNIRDNIRNYWNIDDLKLFHNSLQNEISKLGETDKIINNETQPTTIGCIQDILKNTIREFNANIVLLYTGTEAPMAPKKKLLNDAGNADTIAFPDSGITKITPCG